MLLLEASIKLTFSAFTFPYYKNQGMEMRIEGESIVLLLLSENWNSRPFETGRGLKDVIVVGVGSYTYRKKCLFPSLSLQLFTVTQSKDA